MTKPELKQKYKDDFAKVTLLVNEFDACGFIKIGAPSDEYESLVNKILAHIYDNKTREEIKKMIIHEIEFYFGCLDLSVMKEPYLANFHNDLDRLLDNLEKAMKQ